MVKNLLKQHCVCCRAIAATRTRLQVAKRYVANRLPRRSRVVTFYLIPGEWHYTFLDECETFPNGRFKDQVDAAAGAFTRLTSKPVYNLAAMG